MLSQKECIEGFNNTIHGLLKKIICYVTEEAEVAAIDRIKSRIRLLERTGGPTVLIEKSTEPFLAFSNKIINRDEDFFMSISGDRILHAMGEEARFIVELLDNVKHKYRMMTTAERDDIYNDIKNLHDYCLTYNVHVLEG